MLPQITIKPANHRQMAVLKLCFDYQQEIVDRVRALEGALWSNSMKSWYIPDTESSKSNLKSLDGVELIFETAVMGDNEANSSDQFKRLMINRYAKGRLRLEFKFDSELIALIRTMPFYFYDADQLRNC